MNSGDIEILDGHVFIADQMDFKIKVFSREGAFIREMGGRGRGPGELQHITSMWKAPDGKRIHVVDYFNRKVVTFTKDGSLVFPYSKDCDACFNSSLSAKLSNSDKLYAFRNCCLPQKISCNAQLNRYMDNILFRRLN